MIEYRPEKIFLEESVAESPITGNVLRQLPDVAVQPIESTELLLEAAKALNPTIPVAKRSLILARHRGRFFKPCPAASLSAGNARNVCCNYFVVNYASNCHMECSYCYLQSYLNFPYLILYANSDDLLRELDETISSSPESFFRIGTGELADSLALDPLSGYSAPLVEFFARRKNAVLEFKTKSNCVDNLLGLEHRGRTVVSWSINPRFVQQREEHKTADIGQRLEAAGRCAEAGYPVAFHFDPLIHYRKWEKDYRELVDEIFDRIPADSIPWISIGSLRLTPDLKQRMRERFPGSFLPLGEMAPAEDGKLRYVKPIRLRMYRRVHDWIRARASRRTAVYACMERPEVWTKVFQRQTPSDESENRRITAGVGAGEPR